MSTIARVWFGDLKASKLEEYVDYVKETGVHQLRATKGNRGVLLLTRRNGEGATVAVISFWDSRESIKAFAGEDINKAVYYPRDAEYLIAMEKELQHFEVNVAEGVDFFGKH